MSTINDIYDLEPDTQRAPVMPEIPDLRTEEDFNQAVRNLWDASLALMWTDKLNLVDRRADVDRAAHAVMVMQSILVVIK